MSFQSIKDFQCLELINMVTKATDKTAVDLCARQTRHRKGKARR